MMIFFFYGSGDHRDLHSFPTRRSSDLRSLGGLWTVGEGSGDMPGGGTAKTIMTLGYDPQKKRFVGTFIRSEEHTSELQSQSNLVCRLLLEKKKTISRYHIAANYLIDDG